MKKLILLCSILFSAYAFAQVEVTELNEIEIGQDKEVERHWHNFGMVRVNTRSYASYGLKNTGTTPMTFVSARISGIDFYASHNCGGVLEPQERCIIRIEFAPFSQGYKTGALLFTYVEDYQLYFDLSGNATRL